MENSNVPTKTYEYAFKEIIENLRVEIRKNIVPFMTASVEEEKKLKEEIKG